MNILENIVPKQLPYAIRGGIIRGIRTGVAFVLAGVAASLADGSIIQGITVIPPEYKPFIILGLTTTFTGIDKWLRERGLVEDAANAEIPLTEELPDQVNDIEAAAVPTTDEVPTEESVSAFNPTVFDDPVD